MAILNYVFLLLGGLMATGSGVYLLLALRHERHRTILIAYTATGLISIYAGIIYFLVFLKILPIFEYSIYLRPVAFWIWGTPALFDRLCRGER